MSAATVNLAARLAAAAAGGEILISETARGLVCTAMHTRFEDRGLLVLKGVAEPVRAFALRVPLPASTASAVPPTRPLEAVRQGNLDEAVQLARNLPLDAPADVRCDALTALVIVAASNGDLEGALSWTERLLTVAPRASDRAWSVAASALRAWCYALVRQPAEASAELERALEWPASGAAGTIPLLLAVSLAGIPAHGAPLRRIGGEADDPMVRETCRAIADILEDRPPLRVFIPMLGPLCGPLLAELIELQLTRRASRAAPARVHHPAARRLAAMILDAVQ